MDLEVRHLRAVCAIADAGSITKAAAALGVSQPTLTTQLRRIERLLGGALFVRSLQGASPTALGEFVLAKARTVLPTVEAIQRESALHAGSTDGRRPLRYVATPGPLAVGLLRELKSLFPGALPTLRTETKLSTAADLVLSGQQDLAAVVEYIRPGFGLPADLRSATVATEPAFVLLPATHPLAGQPLVGLAELAKAEWTLSASQGNGLFECFAAACAEAGFTATVRHDAETGSARELIADGQAVGLGQATFRATPGIVPRPLAGTPLLIRHRLLWHRQGALDAHAPAIATRAERVYATAVRRSPHYLDWLADHPAPQS
ncbi:LysR family transcriptional regulator [Streptomyces cinnamoneus]|uniref:LysR family transcriptional regulator n=1 Tax=Streptomyces cinnamoneus TaxID=53446 RepID=A0A918TZE1_STRCJ|nr:LysR family transcriptional regulator [Streptomyces cinnamoneus]GHC71152.1 LysR family transcriptional regulator [Streptomyces cinnamoneus]